MKPLKFYRVEHKKTKLGVYRHTDKKSYDVFHFKLLDAQRHPAPWEDSLLAQLMKEAGWGVEINEEYIFGFKSLSQLKSWFYSNKMIEALDKFGFVLNLYRTKTRMAGNTQAVAHKNSLNFVKAINLKSLIK